MLFQNGIPPTRSICRRKNHRCGSAGLGNVFSGRAGRDVGGGAVPRMPAATRFSDLQCLRLFQQRARPGRQAGYRAAARPAARGRSADQGAARIRAARSHAMIDQRRHQRHIEQHCLRVAERDQSGPDRKDSAAARDCLRLDVLRQQPGGPELPGDIAEIERAGDLDDQESGREGLGDRSARPSTTAVR